MTHARPWSRLVAIIRQFTRAHPSLQDEQARQNAQLLSGLLLSTIFAIGIIIALVIYFDPGDVGDPRTLAAYVVIFFNSVLYIINRKGYTRWATYGFLATISVILVGTTYLGDFPEFLAFSAMPMLLFAMFYPFRPTALFIIAIVGINFLLLNTSDNSIWERRILWYFLLFTGALMLAFVRHLNNMEHIRRRKLDAANTHLQATLNAIPDLLLEIDRAGHLLSYQSPQEPDLRISLDNFIGQNLFNTLITGDNEPLLRTAIEEAAKTGKHAGAVFSTLVNNVQQWFEVSISAKGNGATSKDMHFVVVARNITERRQAEALRAEHTRLELALEKEKEITELRSQMISTITHEFRTPLSVILTSTSLLVDYGEQLSPERQQQKIQTIVEQVKRLDSMLENVGHLSQSQRGFLQYNPIDVNIINLCQQLIAELQSIALPTIQLILAIQTDLQEMRLDVDLMRHIITNLISNSIKYSPDGGNVTVTLKQEDGVLVLQFQDEGIGIPLADLDNLFQPFRRASNVGQIHGTGLGLSIVHEAVTLQGGEITCESQVGMGTTFTICLPIKGQHNDNSSRD